jgi:hypothetical protein
MDVLPSCMGEVRNSRRILVGKLEGKIQFGRPTCRSEALKWILKKHDMTALNGLDLSDSR